MTARTDYPTIAACADAGLPGAVEALAELDRHRRSILVTCPLCGGHITPGHRTAEGNRRGTCTACGEPVTITVSADNAGGITNPHAPFFPLVQLIDRLDNVDPRRIDGAYRNRSAWRRTARTDRSA